MHIHFSRRIVPALAIALITTGLYLIPNASQAATVSIIDTTSKAAVTNAYNDIYKPTLNVPVGWTGSTATCDAGAPSAVAKDAVITAFNYMRAMAGLPSVTEDPAQSVHTQQAALMMQANSKLAHDRDFPSWACYSPTGVLPSNAGEIIATTGTARAIPLYMLDSGAGNQAMGHRATVLEGYAKQIGVGSTTGYNAIQWVPNWGAPASVDYLQWPSKGYFPYELVQPTATRWSFYLASGDASKATVTVTKNGVALSIAASYPANNALDPTQQLKALGWDMPAITAPAPGATDTYQVTISGITGGKASTVTYDVLIFSVEPLSLTVSFDANGGTTPQASKKVTYLEAYGDLPTPTRTGYDFQGWFTQSSGGTKVVGTSAVELASNHSLYAQWKAQDYTVAFDANGGMTPTSSKTVTFGQTFGTLPDPTYDGHTFQGWYTAASGGTKILATSQVDSTGNRTLYAQWKANQYVVSFDANGGTTSVTSKQVTYLESYGVLPAPTRDGYDFQGWFTQASGGTKVISTSQVTATADHSLNAQWQAQNYTVSFDAAGGTTAVTSKQVTYSQSYGDLPTPTRDGYDFQGWFTQASGGTKVVSTSQVTATANHSLYAQWQAQDYTITFDANGGVTTTSSKTVTFGQTYGTLPVPTYDGYTFQGWFAKADGTGDKATSETAVTGDVTLYAKWVEETVPTYSVSYDANGGTGSVSDAGTYVSGESATALANGFARDGYSFMGWNTAADGSGTAYAAGDSVTVSEDVTLYAQWMRDIIILPSVPTASVDKEQVTTETTLGAARLADGQDSYTVVVTVVDEQDRPMSGLGARLSVVAPAGVSAGSITDNGDGTYSFPVSSATPGNYQVQVLLDGELIESAVPVNFIAAKVGSQTRVVGDQQSADGLGFLPGEQVTVVVYSEPLSLGVFTADGTGTVPVSFAVPADFETGTHSVWFYGEVSGSVGVPFEVVAAGTEVPDEKAPDGKTPDQKAPDAKIPGGGAVIHTSEQSMVLALVAAGLLAGLGVVGLRRRRA